MGRMADVWGPRDPCCQPPDGDQAPILLELREDALDDRRRCLPRSAAGQLTLGGERQAGDARAAVAGRFADEQVGGARSVFEIRTKPLPSEPCAGSRPIEVEGRTDASRRKS